jgi:hypothetical protein
VLNVSFRFDDRFRFEIALLGIVYVCALGCCYVLLDWRL